MIYNDTTQVSSILLTGFLTTVYSYISYVPKTILPAQSGHLIKPLAQHPFPLETRTVVICPAAYWPYRTVGILNSWPKKESCHTSYLFSRHAGRQRVFEDAHPWFGKLSDFLSFRITNKVMVEGHKGPQVNDLFAGGLEQQVGAGIGLVGAVEAGDLVVCGLEGK